MTLSEIVGQAKEGDRFVADWMLKSNHKGSYYYLYCGSLKINRVVMGKFLANEPVSLGSTIDLTADYTFLPLEPKFKVGDRVRVVKSCYSEQSKLSVGCIAEIKSQEFDEQRQMWKYIFHSRLGNRRSLRENDLELYNPDTCDCCGQEFPKGDIHKLVFPSDPPIEWDGGDLPKWKAYFLTWKMWEWLARNPRRNKSDWPQWMENGGKVRYAHSYCFACQHKHCQSARSVGDCIMAGLWPSGCLSETSPFGMWEAKKEDKGCNVAHYAQTIADFARDKYFEEIRKDKEDGK